MVGEGLALEPLCLGLNPSSSVDQLSKPAPASVCPFINVDGTLARLIPEKQNQ